MKEIIKQGSARSFLVVNPLLLDQNVPYVHFERGNRYVYERAGYFKRIRDICLLPPSFPLNKEHFETEKERLVVVDILN